MPIKGSSILVESGYLGFSTPRIQIWKKYPAPCNLHGYSDILLSLPRGHRPR